MKSGILLAAATLALAGCSGAPAGTDTAEAAYNNSFVSPNLAGGTWQGVFDDPASSIDHFARIGLRPGAYEKVGGEWRSEAVPTAMTDPSAPNRVMAMFVAAGGEKKLSRVTFTLVEPLASNDQQARDQFDKWMSQALTQLGVAGGDQAVKAIHGEASATGKVPGGARYAVDREPTDKDRLLAVTFTPGDPILNGTDPTAS